MRWVILFASIAFFLIYDGLYNEGRWFDMFIRWIISLLRLIGVS
ncbi:MAG TPA: hypothetical protein VMF90_00435 [Rhizobiaceae bacterium]|nr:hypothetical protein [Rhizobiaceae bacterium]